MATARADPNHPSTHIPPPGQVIEVNLTSESPQEIAAGKTYHFTYSVEWVETDKLYEDRFSRYLDYSCVASPALPLLACLCACVGLSPWLYPVPKFAPVVGRG
jgi:hypothetical protein